jgi:hypothetical protein
VTDFEDEAPLTTRGVPRTRFDPLRDAPRSKTAEFGPEDAEIPEFEPGVPFSASEALISAVRRQIAALGLSESVEGSAAVLAAEKAADAVGSAAAACLHELRMAMNEIRTSKPVGEVRDATEDVLSRRRERKAGG